ncbi:DUF378 domain-containing protein [Butyricicoccus sp.]|uniref:DUF378 domain-containing protein n=1 Tax=Butyricicoccus sp. TaxID=2049021 RepID=UPI003AAF074F
MDKFILTLVIIGAINWGCIGFFGLDVVGVLFGGQSSFVSRVIYALVGLAGLWALTFYAKLRSGTSNS